MEISKLRSRKLRKPSDGDRENVVDRLSGLPDDILIHILAFLPTKIYVATSILGRRWRFLWARVPNLDFDDDDFGSDDDDARVSSIITRVMFLHKREKINSFRFGPFEDAVCSDYEFEKLIVAAIECNVQELDISLDGLRLPLCIFTCKTLVILSLAHVDMPTIGTVYLPSLKKLHLDRVRDESDESFAHLLSGCPVLDELFIIIESGNNKICISSNTINRLELEIDYDMHSYSHRNVMLKLNTPALQYLEFKSDYVPKNYSKVPRFSFFPSAETFHSLTFVKLEADWGIIRRFLENADNLEVLTIGECYFNDNPTYWIDPKQVPACLVLHLETVRIRGFMCKEHDFKVVRYILRNAKVLKRMEISTCRMDSNKQLEALKRISLFERGSDACQLAFD